MAVASPRLFLALCFSLLFSLPACLYPPLSLVLFVLLPCIESIPCTHTRIHTYTHMHIHIHIDTKCVPCFRSFCVPSFDSSSSSSSSCSSSRPVPSSRLVFVPHEHTDSELPYRVSRSENSSVGPGQESLMNLRLEVSPDSRAVDTGRN